MQVQGENSCPLQALRWSEFLRKTAQSAGSLLLASSLVSWVAANWAYASAFQKLTGAQVLLTLMALLTIWLLYARPYRNHYLAAPVLTAVFAAVCLGGLLALAGQIYQTGANTWQLFFLWAILLLPWLITLHATLLALLFATLLNLAAVLYFDVHQGNFGIDLFFPTVSLTVAMVLLNMCLLALWELLHAHLKDPWRAGPRLLGAAAMGWALMTGLGDAVQFAVGVASIAGTWWFYARRRPDAVLVALAGLAALGLFTIRVAPEVDTEQGLLLLILVLMGLTGLLLAYLRRRLVASRPSDADTDTDTDTAASASVGDPWFISLVRLSAMMATAALVLVFLLITLEVEVDGLWIVGWLVGGVGLLVLRSGRMGFVREAGATLACAGLLLTGISLHELGGEAPALRALGVMATGLLAYVAGGGFALRWFSATFSIAVAMAITWPHAGWALDLLDGAPAHLYTYTPLWSRLWLLTVLAVLALIFSGKPRQVASWSPLAWACLVLAQALAYLVPAVSLYDLALHGQGQPSLLALGLAMAMLPVCVLVALLWPAHDLGRVLRVGAPLVLAVACLAWMGTPGVSLGVLWLLLGFAQGRRSLLLFGVLSTLGYLAVFYYQLETSLLYKSFIMAATGAWLLASALVLRQIANPASRPTRDFFAATPADGPSTARRWRIGGMAAGLVIMLLVVNTGIYQREQILAAGKTVILELAPVDPRALMQGDYMALYFDVSRQLAQGLGRAPESLATQLQASGGGFLVLTPDQRGVHRLEGLRTAADGPTLSLPGLAGAGSGVHADRDQSQILLGFQMDGTGIVLVTNAWFFAEGQAAHFERARYGKLLVTKDGRGALVQMLDDAMQPL